MPDCNNKWEHLDEELHRNFVHFLRWLEWTVISFEDVISRQELPPVHNECVAWRYLYWTKKFHSIICIFSLISQSNNFLWCYILAVMIIFEYQQYPHSYHYWIQFNLYLERLRLQKIIGITLQNNKIRIYLCSYYFP